jgi:hypothetical protein
VVVNDGELIAKAYALLGQGHVEAAEGYFERYMAGRVRVVGEGALREAWQRDVAERRAQVAERERAERKRRGGMLRRLLPRR